MEMRRKGLLFVLMTFIMIYSVNLTVFAGEVDKAALNAQRFGFWTLIPPIVAIVLAFITKNVVLSLFLGVFSGAIILQLNGVSLLSVVPNAFLMVVDKILTSLADPWNAGIILQCLAIGGLIALISKMGGAKAIAESLSKRAKSPVSVQIITWILGIFVFFDDYANSLIVGPIMRPVADKMKISREKLAFIIDATAAPIAGIALISTWVGYEVSLIKDGFGQIGIKANAYNTFVSTIPYRFYNILILVFIVFTAITLREFGSMLKAEKDARSGINVQDFHNTDSKELEPKEGIKLSIWNAIIPILVLIIGAFIGFYLNGYHAIMAGKDKALIDLFNTAPASFAAIREAFGASDASIVLFQSALFASIVAIFMGVVQKIFTVSEAIDTWVEGTKTLVITGVILLLAWSLSAIIKDLGTAKFLVSMLSDKIPMFLLPTLIFVLASIISFATGTSYGTMGILMPLTIPLASAIASGDFRYLTISISAVLTGAIFGDHCSPISDTTILSSMGAGCDHIKHVRTQMTYSLCVAVVTGIFGYIPVTLGVPVYVVLILDSLILFAIVRFVGKPVS
ncbi:Na+/H+ antiporter NhaC family protein [Haloimpatiens lingqiaonensis]|uniref:Na+/H+ antiporter NhaC family protein n=1 Tax=Haloimpatiens lingqiaonensis TaxID=1380675 RepID=UPI0010FE32B3|nr:Na+/H+ antiporter NhaC family protein [Haloimpatiens lingqiaonensis]